MATQPPNPPDFIPDDEMPDFIPDAEMESQSAPAKSNYMAPGIGVINDLVTGAGKGFVKSLDPRPLVGLAKNLATHPIDTTTGIVKGIPGAIRAAIDAATSGDPEQIGELAGSGLGMAVPFTGAVKSARIAERLAGALGVSRAGRIRNIVRSVAGDKNIVPEITRLEDTIDLPVAATHTGLERKVAAQIEAESPKLAAAKESLTGDIPIEHVTGKMELPGTPLTIRGEGGRMTRTIATGDPALRNAMTRRKGELERLGKGRGGTLPAQVVQSMKEEAQGAAERGGVYRKQLPGDTLSPGAAASGAEASALKQALEEMGTPEAEALKQANAIMHRLQLLREPLAKETARRASIPPITRATEALAGRAGLPLLAGAGAGAVLSPIGAISGLGIARFMQSPAWQSLSAAAKRKLIPYLERGDISAFQNETMKAIALASTPSTPSERLAAAERAKTLRQMRQLE